ncbi:DUF2073 domain-containing protein [archaeon]|jgi:hypothetical protein|nr:DUF2073 domain-containing protein [archaeon]
MMTTFQYIPYREHSSQGTDEKLNRILDIVKNERVILMEGRLKPTEELELMKRNMEAISKKFSGISLVTINPNQDRLKKKDQEFHEKIKEGIKNNLYKLMMGKREGLTIIGPASIIKEIRKDPSKIELITNSEKKKPLRKRKK